MFYMLNLEKSLDVHPRHFGKNLRKYVNERLLETVEGTCHGKYGYVVSVVGVSDLGEGTIRQDGTGFATFNVKYRAIVCRPYKYEVIDTVVTSVNKLGFFAEAGPLTIFVSNHLIPDDWEFNAVGDPCYQSTDGSLTIQEGGEVRLRIMGTRMDQSDIFCIGTIKEDYLGVISNSDGPFRGADL